MELAALLVVVLCASTTSVLCAPPNPPSGYCRGEIIAPQDANYKNFACSVTFMLRNGSCSLAQFNGRWLSDKFFGKWKEKCRRNYATVDCFCTTRKCNEDVELVEQKFKILGYASNGPSQLKAHVKPCLDSLRAILPTKPKDSSPIPTRSSQKFKSTKRQKGNTESNEEKDKSTTAGSIVVIPENGDATSKSPSDGHSSKPKSTTSKRQIVPGNGGTTEKSSTDTEGSGRAATNNPDGVLPGSTAKTTASGEEPNPESSTTAEELATKMTTATDEIHPEKIDGGEDVTSSGEATKSADEPTNGGETEVGQADGTTKEQFSTGIPATGETTKKTTTAELAVIPAGPRADEGTGSDQEAAVTEGTSSEKVSSGGGGTPAWLIVLIIIIAVLCVGLIIGGYVLYKDKREKKADLDKDKKADEEKGLGTGEARPVEVPRAARMPGKARRVPIVYDEQDSQAILDGRNIPLDILSDRRFTNMGPLHMKAPKMETLEKTGPIQSSRSLKDGPIEFDDAGNQIFMMGSSIEIIDESEKEAATQESSRKEKSKKEASRVDASRNTSKKDNSKKEVSKTQPSSKKEERSMPTQPSASKKSDKKEPVKDNVKEDPTKKE